MKSSYLLLLVRLKQQDFLASAFLRRYNIEMSVSDVANTTITNPVNDANCFPVTAYSNVDIVM